MNRRFYTIEGKDCSAAMQGDLIRAREAAKSKIFGACGFFGGAVAAFIIGYAMLIISAIDEQTGMLLLALVIFFSTFVFAGVGGAKLSRAIKGFNQVRRLQNIVTYIKSRPFVSLKECPFTKKYVKESCILVEGLIELGHLNGYILDNYNATVSQPNHNAYQAPKQAQASPFANPVPPNPVKNATNVAYCPNCGASADGAFCSNCGGRL